MPSGSASGSTKMPAIDADDVGHRDRRDHIFGNAVADQLAIEPDVVVVADDDDLGAGIAIFGELAERFQQLARLAPRFQDDQVGRRRRLVELDRRRDAAHMDLEMRLGHAPVVAGALDRIGDAFGLAERLDRDARHRPQRLHRSGIAVRRRRRHRCLYRRPDCSLSCAPSRRHASEVDFRVPSSARTAVCGSRR